MSPSALKSLRKSIGECWGADRGKLHRELNRLQRHNGAEAIKTLQDKIDVSQAKVSARRESLPVPQYPDELPVAAARDEIIAAIHTHQVVIVCGETGSGKTTQLPKMCMELGRGTTGLIGHTQPRRIAARSVATRIAEELDSPLGEIVGYKVRFSDRVSTNGYLKLMTDGILLAEIQHDRWLNQYDTLIIDEAHERSLNIDFLLGFLKQLLPRRPDLKIIITSATINPEIFSQHFNDAPIINVEGRSYPVEMRYAPLQSAMEENETELADAIVAQCELLIREQRGQSGDVLVFLPGERDIRECRDSLEKARAASKELRDIDVLPLFARLSATEQTRVFQRHGQRRVVLATNVAETSLTVPGIRFVIDSGLARVSRYSLRSKVQRLPIEKISQASARQRAGRCGREAPGICVRLYDEEDFQARPTFTDPEILRTNLAAVVLQMAAMRLGEIEHFPFVEKPDARLIRDGYQLLFELGGVSDSNALTKLGKKLARLPIEPRFARMLLAAGDEGCVSEILTITSALSVIDPRDRPQEKRQAADEMHGEFNDESSDFSAWLNLWAFIDVQWSNLSRSKFRKMCQSRFLSYLRIREWQDVRRQLQSLCEELKLRENSEEASYDAVHRAILSGLLGNVSNHDEKSDYRGTRNRKVRIFPGSGLFSKKPKWMVAAEISETTQLYARTVAKINIDWVEHQGAHLLKHTYSAPYWEKKRGQVGAKRKSTLYGLLVNGGKSVNYGSIDPVQSRDVFIREGLVAGQLKTAGPFYQHNLDLVDEVLTLEHKSRRRDILVSPEELVQFYNAIIPDDVYSQPTFERWRKAFEEDHPRGLFFDKSQLMRDEDVLEGIDEFPDVIEMGGAT
ncbi:MAG: ATP-dependent RNA helicase HrpA, partial [Pseudomonadota bacterium]